MTKVVFETAGLMDAVREAMAVAPTRGEAFDKAAGIVLDVQRNAVVVTATDLRIRYKQWVTPLEIEGPPVEWRLPSKVFGDIITKLSLVSTHRLILEQAGRQLNLKHNRKSGTFNLIDSRSYPSWPPFDPEGLVDVEDFALRVNQVEWAASRGTDAPLTGIHFTGERIVCTDRYILATAPLKMELDEPITVPAGLISSVVKQTDHVKIGMGQEGEAHTLHIMPDDHTQIECGIYGVKFPPVENAMLRNYKYNITIQKATIIDLINGVLGFAIDNRQPIVELGFGRETIACKMANQETGLLRDIVDIPGQANHDWVTYKFDPKLIMAGLEHSPSTELTMGYTDDKKMQSVYFNAGSGIEFWVSKLRDVQPSA